MNAATGGPRSGSCDRGTLAVAAVDVFVLVGLIAVGLLSHDVHPLADPLRTLETATPFVLGWLAVAVPAGVYGDAAHDGPRQIGRTTAVAWLAAANVGLILRSSPLFDGGATWPFNLVITGSGLVALLSWRVARAAVVD